MMQTNIGTVTLMGSGELAESMSRTHRTILARLGDPVHAVFLDTPAGFELNADEISAKAVEYFAQRFSITLRVASFQNKARAHAVEVESALRQLRHANFVFAGPGSPSYAVRNWRGTIIWDTLVSRLLNGAQVVFASAAAIATGACALPVYEIYKAGADPEWIDGLDLLGLFGLKLAVVPHWNNAEGGTFDTRFCYMGEPRLEQLERQLPFDTVILGIDEYTACILDPNARECRVMGAGQVTIRHAGRESNYPAGATFGFERLRVATIEPPYPHATAPERETAAIAPAVSADGAYAEAGRYLVQLARALDEAHEPMIRRDLIDQAHDTMHELAADWIDAREEAPGEDIAPFVQELIETRARLRAAKQFALADEIRQRLAELGIALEDAPSGTTWKKAKE